MRSLASIEEEATSRWNDIYDGRPPWDTGCPQPEFVRLAEEGAISGDVLDVGCGTGENAIHLASRGNHVLGVDVAPKAIEIARAKAKARGSPAEFEVADALDLSRFGRRFDAIIDSGLFHIFDDEDRPVFSRSLAAVAKAGAVYHLLCFSEHEPGPWGPRRVTQAEIRSAFSDGWRVEEIRAARFETAMNDHVVKAWLATIRQVG